MHTISSQLISEYPEAILQFPPLFKNSKSIPDHGRFGSAASTPEVSALERFEISFNSFRRHALK
jgi:hypothetical protein